MRASTYEAGLVTVSGITTHKSVLEGIYPAEQRYLAAGGPGAASFDTLAPFFATDVVLYQAENLPYGGIWRGHAGMERFFTTMAAVWERFDIGEQIYLSETSPLVVSTRVRARARAGGGEIEFPILQTIVVADHRITEVRPFYWDTAAIRGVCGYS